MPARNERCPCGSGEKYKRCCLKRREAVANELRQRDAFLAELIEWLKNEHGQTLERASEETVLIRLLRGPTGRSMSLVWALNDYRPADGGPPLLARYAGRSDLDASARVIADGLAQARLGVYRVIAFAADLWIELEPLTGGERLRILAGDGLEQLEVGEILVARIVTATSVPTPWGLGVRFAAGSERRWRARLASLPADPARAALVVLGFHPDDAAEPLPDGVDLYKSTWSIGDDDAVIEALEDEDLWECIGEAIPSGWVFSWPDDPASGVLDLGGCGGGDGEIEAARLIVCEREMTLISADRRTLVELGALLEQSLGWAISARPEMLAA
jgi:hypothetical protein